MKKILILGVLLATVGCATLANNTLDWIPTGPEFSPTKPEDMEMLASSKEIKRAYGNIGMLRINNLRPDTDTLKMGIEKGRPSEQSPKMKGIFYEAMQEKKLSESPKPLILLGFSKSSVSPLAPKRL